MYQIFHHKNIDIDNIKYTVDNEIQKANLLKSENVLGFMPRFYYNAVLKDSDKIIQLRGVEIDFPLEPHLILVYKHSKYKDQLLKIIRNGIQKIQDLYN